MTVAELNYCISSYIERKNREYKQQMSIAYAQSLWTAQWVVGKQKPKPLDTILNEPNKKEMSNNEMLNQIKQINSALGGGTY